MNFLFKKTTIFLIFFGITFLFLSPINANDDICPEGVSLEQCYADLNKKMQDLEAQAKKTTERISQERFNQLTFNERIEYTEGQIQASENEIRMIEMEIQQKNVEIRMMERDIEKTEEKIVSVQQEAQQLESSITKRISMSYKFSFMDPLTLLTQAEDLEHFLRKMRYLVDTRRNDKEMLSEMNNRGVVLDAEQRVLGRSKLNLEEARIEVEDKKTALFKEKENLAAQKQQLSSLLAQSKQREETHKSELVEIEKAQNQVTEQISAIIRAMYERGEIPLERPVKKGDWIGVQGYTGFTYGSHLHLEVYNSAGTRINPFSAGLFTGGSLYGTVGSANYHYPLNGGVLTQTFHSVHPAIDLQSATEGHQAGDQYYGEEIRCLGMVRRAGFYNKRGTGAPIRAITDGYVSKQYTDVCGGKYVILKHDDGGMSLYLHLQ